MGAKKLLRFGFGPGVSTGAHDAQFVQSLRQWFCGAGRQAKDRRNAGQLIQRFNQRPVSLGRFGRSHCRLVSLAEP